eukprot:8776412-Ditylum_brightwellii.AAC.1
MTSKGLRHIQMQENVICEVMQMGFASIEHVNGKINLSDIFTKEDKDTAHFLTLQDILMSPTPAQPHIKTARQILVVPKGCSASHQNS